MKLQALQKLKAVQKMSMKTIQSLSLLQMGEEDLERFLAELSENNPVLELSDDFWGSKNLYTEKSFGTSSGDGLSIAEVFAPADDHTSLFDHIKSQMLERALPPEICRTILYIISGLDKSGIRTETENEIASDLSVDATTVKAALEEIWTMDPPGIAAVSVRESLLLQLARRDEPIAGTIVRDYWKELAAKKYSLISKKLGIPTDAVLRAEKVIQSLECVPARPFLPAEKTQYVMPDIVLEENDGIFELRLLNDWLPKIRVNAYYKTLEKGSDDPEVKEYLQSYISDANDVIHGLSMRRSTLLTCGKAIVTLQDAFFRKKTEFPSPLKLTDVACTAGVHESTVSRAIRGKYLLWSGTVYPLSFFFPRNVQTGAENTANDIKARLQLLFDEEDGNDPLSDQRCAEILSQKGICLSRRVIANYRDEMGIPNAHQRKTGQKSRT